MPTVTAETGDGCVRLSWDDVAERGARPGDRTRTTSRDTASTASTDPEFRDPRVITTGTGSGSIGNGRPIAQFDLVDGRRGYSERTVEGVAYYLGADTGITHTWTDTTVTNGQQYYYAVTAYDYGSRPGSCHDSLAFYPVRELRSRSRRRCAAASSCRRTWWRCGPSRRCSATRPAATEPARARRRRGRRARSQVEVVNSNLVPDGHLFAITLPDRRARTACAPLATRCADSTAHKTLFTHGTRLRGRGGRPGRRGAAAGRRTPCGTVEVDTTRSGFAAGERRPTRASTSPTSERAADQPAAAGLPGRHRRSSSPTPCWTPRWRAIRDPGHAGQVQDRRAHATSGDRQMDFRFYDIDPDGRIDPLTTERAPRPRGRVHRHADLLGRRSRRVPLATWRFELGRHVGEPARPRGTTFRLWPATSPSGADDVFVFRTRRQRVDADRRATEDGFEPYVVPNPYVGAASFEPERFAVSGRGERRIEFRGLPQTARSGSTPCAATWCRRCGTTARTTASCPGTCGPRTTWTWRPGLYIFHVDGGPLGTRIGKFAIIK